MENTNNYPVLHPIYDNMKTLLNSYMSKHSKALITRLDIRYPQGHADVDGNKDISQTMELTMQEFRRKGLDPKYAWVREQNSSSHPHYHAMIILNGHKTQSPYIVQQAVQKHWGSTIESYPAGLVEHCNGSQDEPHENGKVITRNEGVPAYVERQISYMAKPLGKGKPKDGMRDFGMSRIPETGKKKR